MLNILLFGIFFLGLFSYLFFDSISVAAFFVFLGGLLKFIDLLKSKSDTEDGGLLYKAKSLLNDIIVLRISAFIV